jgi:voltage-gated potassium channel
MWWAIETLTTVGYGDMVPVTVFGRIIGGAVSIVGIGTLALFSGLITVGFLDQLKIHREQHPKMAVAISRETITVTKRYEGPAGDSELLPANCPHCGGMLTRATLGSKNLNEPLGA